MDRLPYARRQDVFEHELRPGERPKLTGYRMLVLGLAITFGLSKARLAYLGQSTALNTLDWLYGVGAFLILYWLGIYEKYASTAPWFFDLDFVDYTWAAVVDRTRGRRRRHD